MQGSTLSHNKNSLSQKAVTPPPPVPKYCGVQILHYWIRTCISGHQKFSKNWIFFLNNLYIYFFIRVFFTDTDDSQDSRGREGTIFYSTLPLPPAHEHSDIYLQLCMWDDYHVFLIATLVFTRLLLDEIYHLIELPFEWLIHDAMFVCLLDELTLGFCYSDLTLETGGFELASTIFKWLSPSSKLPA